MTTALELDITSLYPEQVRAMDYLRLRGTVAPIARIREQVASTFAKLEATLSEVPAGLRQVAPREGAWTIHEVLDHLVETHERAVIELRGLTAGKRPETEPIPPGLTSNNPFAASWQSLTDRLHRMHEDFLDAIGRADEATSLHVKAPVVMVVKVPDENGKPAPRAWTYELDWKAYAQAFRVHTIEHIEQIKRTIAAVQSEG
ncbi:MAG: DinB family protein [Candidatus Hydrogenedentes bacterium]|nr:DinB family protein [Candidatus Hydrogenedentota bacterium]